MKLSLTQITLKIKITCTKLTKETISTREKHFIQVVAALVNWAAAEGTAYLSIIVTTG